MSVLPARATIPADDAKVLAILRASAPRYRVWSSIAAELHGLETAQVTIMHVRGVRDACKRLAQPVVETNLRYGVRAAGLDD